MKSDVRNSYHSFVCGRRQRLVQAFRDLQFGGEHGGRQYEHILAKKGDVIRLFIDTRMQSENTCKTLFGGRLKFQSYAHHVNSSQIMCMNYFGPMLLSHRDVLKEIFMAAGIPLKGSILGPGEGDCSQFEYRPRLTGDRTNFDLRICTDDGEELYIEAKYTENGFGKPTRGSLKDSEWEFYRRLCDKSLNLKGISRESFYRDFQVNRNIAHILSLKQYCLFFAPRSNPSLKFPNLDGMRNVSALCAEDFVGLVDGSKGSVEIKSCYHKIHDLYFR